MTHSPVCTVHQITKGLVRAVLRRNVKVLILVLNIIVMLKVFAQLSLIKRPIIDTFHNNIYTY